ncbi:MAG TPA: polysaccharide biosynthesis/export family protein [Armatimonadota bacterium]|nr:polysaccharide biosynthesis/export family protein [Armatimonadota bacterium]
MPITLPGRMLARLAVAVCLALTAGPIAAQSADTSTDANAYVLQQGDVLELVISGSPELRERLPIDIDGNLVGPLIGSIPAAGRTVASIREEARQTLSRLTLPVVAEGGASYDMRIHPNAISINVLEYRPVYVDGDVQNPGGYPFAPGLTVRRAIALAGGLGIASRFLNPKQEFLQEYSRMASLSARREALASRAERLRAEATGARFQSSETAEKDAAGGPAEIEMDLLALRNEQLIESEQALRAAIGKTGEQLLALRAQFTSEEEGETFDREELERLTEAMQAGSITSSRLNDQRRRLNFSTSNKADTMASIALTERNLIELNDRLAQTRLKARDIAFEKLSDVSMQLAETEASLEGSRRTMMYLGGLPSDMRDAAITTIRVAYPDGSEVLLGAGEDADLRPGALVSVEIRFGFDHGG